MLREKRYNYLARSIIVPDASEYLLYGVCVVTDVVRVVRHVVSELGVKRLQLLF